ncbi:MAG: type II secretion system F family protein [Chlorobi bacterium]|nr:type II secretion system F family protein [Chlorobiota bacterium]
MAIDLNKINRNIKAIKLNNTDRISVPNNILSVLNKEIVLFGNKLKDKKKEKFYSELGILLSSGLDIKSALDIIVDEQTKEADKKLFKNINKIVLNGGSLSEALHKTGKFSNYEYFSIKIGEESGRVKNVLEDLTIYYTKKIKQSRQLVNAFSYPILVLITAFAAVFFMMNYMVPMFVDVFSRFGGELPSITKLIISISNFFGNYSGLIFLILLVIIIAIYLLRNNLLYRKISSLILLKFPLLGEIIKKIYLERFCQSMALLSNSKTPMLNSIQMVNKMISFYPFEQALSIIEKDILHGKLLNESMQQFSFFEKRMVSLIKVAEEVNQLGLIFEKLDKQYSEELDYKISMISSLLEPFLIIFVGILVGIILIAMYLPMFRLSTTIF